MFQDFAQAKAQELPELKQLADIIVTSKGKKVLLISHDDADGITSGLLLLRALRKCGAAVTVKLPPRFELLPDELEEYCRAQGYDLVFCLDKGTKARYQKYSAFCKQFIIIDHHPIEGDLGELFYVNPRKRTPTAYLSNSHLVYTTLAYAGLADRGGMLANLFGLVGDFALKTVPWTQADWLDEFVKEAITEFPNLFESKSLRPTMFDVKQRQQTSLLHVMTEIINAVCGTGFQFFYNDRDPSLQELDPPRFIFDQLDQYLDSPRCGTEHTIDDFLAGFPEGARVAKFFTYYTQDWDAYVGLMKSTIDLGTIGPVHVYFFLGKDLRLIPMIGSVKLHEKADAEGHEHAIIVITNVLPDRVHTSLRGTGHLVHCGEICQELTRRVKILLASDQANGGGHPPAAEFVVTEPNVSVPLVLEVLFAYLNELMANPRAC